MCDNDARMTEEPHATTQADASADRDAMIAARNAAAAKGTRRERAARIAEILDELFPDVGSALDHEDAFQLLVATVLSAQCTDARVNLVTPALFRRAASASAMAKMRPRAILPYIKSCGLAPGKAKRLAAMSRALVAKHAGEVPRDMAALEELPGVGHKTASVVVGQAFGDPAFPVDTHIFRLAARWRLSRARDVEEVERDLKELFLRDRWNSAHLQIIYFGRKYCPARGHVPAKCPICSWAMSKARAKAEARAHKRKPAKRTGVTKRRGRGSAPRRRRRRAR
jgi:endonuclease-3